ncbi:Ig-like domain-containing protein [Bradyrhizobium elkanii]|uniref:Ig-like domain-containing protein n=1 Tax=Bradyrhizobium elkanii TaxID=29448 RepID=UPI0020A0F4F0|nr:Ig-like domain-containing protein [Bradyrhizobium elkanii]MCP1926421.1 VCBS repeat-containing protein [Bradyrhizobium elkanii]
MATTPIVINHLSDLQAIQNNLSGYYVLGANIDASGFVFLPIGSAANPFAGFFDGQGHTISNLTINNVSNTDSGLFGDIGATGTVSNVGLINESVTSSYSYVGGLVGENFGTVSQSYVTGNVSGATYVGALVGFNGASGSIIQSFATGAASGQVAGGLVGLNGGAISDSYATGAVNYFRVSLEAGGLAGLNSGSITQSYAAGLVGYGGGFVLGGLVGGETAGSVTVSYWDAQTTGRTTSGGGTGLTTAELQSGVLPVGFDPTIWFDITGQFPQLRWQAPPSDVNHAPVASTIAANANEDTNDPIVWLAASFTDADLRDTFTFSNDTTGTIGLVANNHDGTFNYSPNGKFESLSVGEVTTDTFTYTVTDNHGASSTATAKVTIHGENDAPVALPDFATVHKGGLVAGNVRTNDSDPDAHDILHVSAVNGLDFNVGQVVHGAFGTLTLKVDGSYTYKANNNLGSAESRTAVDTFAYTVDDGHGGSSTATLNINITVNDRPTSVNNTVKLTDGSVAVEMIKLATDAYPFGDTGYHHFDPLNTPLSVTNPAAVSEIQADNWHLVIASELRLNPSALHGPNSIQYSFNNGFYQAIRAGDSLNNDPSEADAIVVTGIVDGQRTLAIAFAGTDQKSDWIDFANFSDHYSKFAPLVAAIKQYVDSGAVDQVLVSGHSLGAAMAQEFMEDPIFKSDPHFHALAWTIGSPGSDNISQDAPDSRITNFYHTLDPIYELTPPLSLFAEFVRSSGSFVQQQFFKGQLQDFLVKSPYGFSSSEAGIVANDLLNNMIVKAHEGTNIEIPFGQPAAHVINNFGTNVDFDAHDQTAYFHDVEAHLTGLSPNSSDFLLHV